MLFIINFFITFFLLQVTCRLTKREAKTDRLVLASAAGGLYSFILLAGRLPAAVSAASKLAAAVVILLLALRFYRVKSFLATLLIFLFVNFVFLGVTVGVYLLFRSEQIKVKNGVVYFDIGARGLLGCAFLAYLLSAVIVRIYNRRTAKNALFWVTVKKDSRSASFFAFADTGNRLREPFSGAPVMVADSEKAAPVAADCQTRMIPAATIGGTGCYQAFKPDCIIIKTDKGEETVDNVYVALSENMKADGYSAVFNPEILNV